ncbi:hypothetical protein E4U42_003631 [Claviceps africana]|uniref:Tryptophan synthase beta chain-like PALP domain-containing protein n=1 Tax=Claviceps africana TaxID=83212 RepID=A0A8K0NKU0_9HYPO|nr:hypothetical protein E4U42_003631 [Claviceps africana]
MISHHHNHRRLQKDAEVEAAPCVQNLSCWADAASEIRSWPEYQPQPLRSLPFAAMELGIANLLYKDESRRFGTSLASYKALGAPYALYNILAKEVHLRTGESPSSAELRGGKYRHVTECLTVCVSTDGNQGRSLAYGAKLFGCRCIIYIHKDVNQNRTQRMKDMGAVVIRVDGDHKASVERAREDARMNDWKFVSSLCWDDFANEIPQYIMNAYMVMVQETISAIDNIQDITHVFVCGGMGSISTAIFLGLYLHIQGLQCHFASEAKNKMPRFVVVEPSEADCLLESAKKGSPQMCKGSLSTLMAGLACRSPSPAAWKVLAWLASDFLAVPDSVAVHGMKALAGGQQQMDVPVVCGESSAATMGVLIEASRNNALRENLGLDSDSQVLLFGLEGATDPEMYQKVVGFSPETVFEAQSAYLSGNEMAADTLKYR